MLTSTNHSDYRHNGMPHLRCALYEATITLHDAYLVTAPHLSLSIFLDLRFLVLC